MGLKILAEVAMKSSVFWDITPYSLLKINWQFGGTCHLGVFITLKIKVTCCYETLADFWWTT
jgi:hypothetical protein